MALAIDSPSIGTIVALTPSVNWSPTVLKSVTTTALPISRASSRAMDLPSKREG